MVHEQLEVWRGDFGKEYTDRNEVDWEDRQITFRGILDGLAIDSVLEIGCNRGHNLIALSHLLGDDCDIVGIEPNKYAAVLARRDELTVFDDSVYDLQFGDGEFNLVFTTGVLIHIPSDRLTNAITEIYRVSNEYILAMEYFSPVDISTSYRGSNDLLWKRNFPEIYMTTFPDLIMIRKGICNIPDEVHWWLWRKGK